MPFFMEQTNIEKIPEKIREKIPKKIEKYRISLENLTI